MPAPTEHPPTWDELPELLTPAEVAAYLRIGRNSAYESIRYGCLRRVACKIGAQWRVDKVRLRALLEAKGDD